MKKEKRKVVALSLTDSDRKKARKISMEVLGKENVSGLFVFWINQYYKNDI